MLDLKGPRRRLADLVLDELRPYLGERRFTVCARHWSLLDAFEGLPVRRVYSVGSARQRDALLRRLAGGRVDGISIHERLLDARVVADLHEVADLVMTWPVNHLERAVELVRDGVDGLITDDATHVTRRAVLERLAWA